jgi:hypothetical protein
MSLLSEGGGSENQGKPRPPAAFCLLGKSKSPPPKEGGTESSELFSVTPTQPAHTQASTHTSTQHLSRSFPPFGRSWHVCPSTAWGAVAGPVWPGRAVADPVGRVTPPQIGRGRRGCGRGGHHPPIRPGAAGWASGIPAGSPLPRGSFWPSPFFRSFTPRSFRYISPSGEASFPWERARGGPSPPLAPRPPGLETQGKPVCPFASHFWWPVRAPQGVRGPPLQPFPSYSGSLPLSLAMVFTGPSPVHAGYCAESYSPWLTRVRHRPRQGSGRRAERLPR